MNIQELLTYIEELSFKTSMIGYDKDEVDIQLDKICDEMEAIVKEKDDEIAALRGGAKPAPVVVDLKSEEEEKKAAEKEVTAQDTDADELIKELRTRIGELERELEAAQDKILASEEEIDALEEELDIARADAETYKEELEKVHAGGSDQIIEEDIVVEAEAPAAEEEAPAVETETAGEGPKDADEAYKLYIRNADLLCKQLALMDDQKNAVLAEAGQEADRIREDAHNEKNQIIEEARAQAEQIGQDARDEAEKINQEAEDNLQKAKDEVEKMLADGKLKIQEHEEYIKELTSKKDSLEQYMENINKDISEMLGKLR